MNKQAFTFLTLFSLILVLSVYYIMLPPVSQDEATGTTLSAIETLQKDLDKKRDEVISKNNEIIAKESSTSESINKALQTISETKNISEQEKQIIEKLKALEYKDVYVEIDDKIIKITILHKESSKTDASKVISEVLASLGNTYQIEVKFISE